MPRQAPPKQFDKKPSAIQVYTNQFKLSVDFSKVVLWQYPISSVPEIEVDALCQAFSKSSLVKAVFPHSMVSGGSLYCLEDVCAPDGEDYLKFPYTKVEKPKLSKLCLLPPDQQAKAKQDPEVPVEKGITINLLVNTTQRKTINPEIGNRAKSCENLAYQQLLNIIFKEAMRKTSLVQIGRKAQFFDESEK